MFINNDKWEPPLGGGGGGGGELAQRTLRPSELHVVTTCMKLNCGEALREVA